MPTANAVSTVQEQQTAAFKTIQEDLSQRFAAYSQAKILIVDIDRQEMHLLRNGQLTKTYPISASTKGAGSQKGSMKTPLGVHRIKERYGDNATAGTIFKGRQNTGKIAQIFTEPYDSPSDHVTTRILWLDGLEPGLNKSGNVDSHDRYIYIHGTHEEGLIGKPASHGCIRMLNNDVIELYEQIPSDTLVVIKQNLL